MTPGPMGGEGGSSCQVSAEENFGAGHLSSKAMDCLSVVKKRPPTSPSPRPPYFEWLCKYRNLLSKILLKRFVPEEGYYDVF